ncbi:MAG: hypothetical protein KBD24_03030 [Candidatus Pacebacteria bacterium]|nr:hypothetical protein [Candidatus Paceibacterota bacterium]
MEPLFWYFAGSGVSLKKPEEKKMKKVKTLLKYLPLIMVSFFAMAVRAASVTTVIPSIAFAKTMEDVWKLTDGQLQMLNKNSTAEMLAREKKNAKAGVVDVKKARALAVNNLVATARNLSVSHGVTKKRLAVTTPKEEVRTVDKVTKDDVKVEKRKNPDTQKKVVEKQPQKKASAPTEKAPTTVAKTNVTPTQLVSATMHQRTERSPAMECNAFMVGHQWSNGCSEVSSSRPSVVAKPAIVQPEVSVTKQEGAQKATQEKRASVQKKTVPTRQVAKKPAVNSALTKIAGALKVDPQSINPATISGKKDANGTWTVIVGEKKVTGVPTDVALGLADWKKKSSSES